MICKENTATTFHTAASLEYYARHQTKLHTNIDVQLHINRADKLFYTAAAGHCPRHPPLVLACACADGRIFPWGLFSTGPSALPSLQSSAKHFIWAGKIEQAIGILCQLHPSSEGWFTSENSWKHSSSISRYHRITESGEDLWDHQV